MGNENRQTCGLIVGQGNSERQCSMKPTWAFVHAPHGTARPERYIVNLCTRHIKENNVWFIKTSEPWQIFDVLEGEGVPVRHW